MKKRLLAMIVLGGMVCGCEQPVNPGAIRIYQGVQTVMPVDSIWIYLSQKDSSSRVAVPGEKLTLGFEIINTVRDDVFLQFDESTAYVSSLNVYLPGEINPRIYPGKALVVNPEVSAAPYRQLPAARGGAARGSLTVNLPVELPKEEWERVEIAVVFSVRGYTRETKGEFRDTKSQTVVVTRRTPASAPAKRVVPGGSGLIYSRPTSGPATEPALRR